MIEDFFSEFLKEKFVFIKGNKYFAQLFTNNPHYQHKLEKLFGKGVDRFIFSFTSLLYLFLLFYILILDCVEIKLNWDIEI